jgi:hypothetical protein
VKHPAVFSEEIQEWLQFWMRDLPGPILDPFAGVGTVHMLGRSDTVGVEIESEWALQHERTVCGDSRFLVDMFGERSFGSVVTSPVYGNRMSDTYLGTAAEREGDVKRKRRTYSVFLGRRVSDGSAAGMQWGKEYRDFHETVWGQCSKILREDGKFVLNIKDHYRDGVVQKVSDWHRECLEKLGFKEEGFSWIATQGFGFGANLDKKEMEKIYVFSR